MFEHVLFYVMCSLRFENNLLSSEGVHFASIWKKTLLSKLSFAFVLLALPLLVPGPTYFSHNNTYVLVMQRIKSLCRRQG